MEKLSAVRQMLERGALDETLSRLRGGDAGRERAAAVLDGPTSRPIHLARSYFSFPKK